MKKNSKVREMPLRNNHMITNLNLPLHLEILLTMTCILKRLERDILHYFLVFQDSRAKGFGGKFPKIHVAMLNAILFYHNLSQQHHC